MTSRRRNNVPQKGRASVPMKTPISTTSRKRIRFSMNEARLLVHHRRHRKKKTLQIFVTRNADDRFARLAHPIGELLLANMDRILKREAAEIPQRSVCGDGKTRKNRVRSRQARA